MTPDPDPSLGKPQFLLHVATVPVESGPPQLAIAFCPEGWDGPMNTGVVGAMLASITRAVAEIYVSRGTPEGQRDMIEGQILNAYHECMTSAEAAVFPHRIRHLPPTFLDDPSDSP